MLKELGTGLATVAGICLYLALLAGLLQFTMRSPSPPPQTHTQGQLRLMTQPLARLRTETFAMLSAGQTKAMDEMTADWCLLFGCDPDMKRETIEVYEEFCKETLARGVSE